MPQQSGILHFVQYLFYEPPLQASHLQLVQGSPVVLLTTETNTDAIIQLMKVLAAIFSHLLFFIAMTLLAVAALVGLAYQKLSGDID